MNETKQIIRKQIKFYGRVQGVGFRYTAYYSATELGLTGWVHNEWDGSVLMEVQGTEATITRLLDMLGSGRFISISDMEMKNIPVITDEHRFQVH